MKLTFEGTPEELSSLAIAFLPWRPRPMPVRHVP